MKKITTLTIMLLLVIACVNTDTNHEKMPGDVASADYINRGDSIVKITFDTLRNTLLNTISGKGLQGALLFCNVQALPITSLYGSEKITVSRLSDKNRNPANALSADDRIIWEKYIDIAVKKDSLKPVLVSRNNEQHYYKPILIQPMCLSCHGEAGKEIPQSLITVIDSLYPADKAKGYKPGDLRGMWHIVFTE